ncbi:hypothetical protein PG985_010899 [Apiospora marii]|uniref:uncharacterized protein n=1 Tax=Apiospora marii TaxID=335849 RepID=UPI00312D4034
MHFMPCKLKLYPVSLSFLLTLLYYLTRRVIIHDTALYPDVAHFRTMLIEEMRKLVEQFGQGHREDGTDT